MPTIADLNIGTAIDPAGIDAGLGQVARKIESFARSVDSSGAGLELAEDIIGGLKRKFSAAQSEMQAALESGLLDPAGLADLAERASSEYTSGLKKGLGSLAVKGLVTDDVRRQFEAAFGRMGDSSAQAFATTFAAASQHIDTLIGGQQSAGTQVESVKGLQQAEVALEASLKATTLTLDQRMQVAQQLSRVQDQLTASSGATAQALRQTAAAQAASAVTAREAAVQAAVAAMDVRQGYEGDIEALQRYARTVDITSRTSVAAFRESVQAQIELGESVNVPLAQLEKLDRLLKRVDSQAANARGVGKFVDNTTSEFTKLGNRAGNAIVGIGFALDGLAQSGASAENAAHSILRTIASLGVAFGPTGLIVSGVAASTDAIITIFTKTRDEMKKATDAALSELDRLNHAGANAAALAANTISQGNPFAATGDERVGLSGLKRQKAELEAYIATIKASEKYRQLEASVQRLRAMGVTQVEAYTVQQKGLLHGLDEQLASVEGRIAPMQQRLDNIVGLTHRLASAEAERAATGARLAKEADAAAKALNAGALETRVANIAAAASIAQAALAQIPAALAGVDAGVAANTEAARRFVAVYQSTALEAFDEVTRRIKQHGPVLDEELAKLAQMRSQLAALPIVQMLRLEQPKVTPRIHVVAVVDSVEAPPNIAPITVPLTFDETKLQGLATHLADLTAARRAVEAAGLGDETQRRAGQEAQGVLALTGAWQRYVGTLVEGHASTEELAEASKRFQRILRDAGIDANALGLSLDNPGDGLDQAAQAAHRLGDAFGGVGDSVGDVLSSISDVKKALKTLKAPGLSFGESLAGAASILGAIGTVGNILGSIGQPSQTQLEHDRILSENNQQLAELKLSLDRFGETAGSIGATRDSLARILANPATAGAEQLASNGIGVVSDAGMKQLAAIAAQAGTSLAELNKVAKDNGITLLDENGHLVAGSLEQLAEAIGTTTDILTRWGRSFDDQRRLLGLERRASGVDTSPAQQIDDLIGLITDQTGAGIDSLFAGIDTSTKAGQEQLRLVIKNLIHAIREGGLSLEELGGFGSATEFGGALDALLDSLDALRGGVDGVTDSLLNVPEIFKLARVRFESALPEIPGAATPPATPTPRVPPVVVPPEPPVVIPPLVFPEDASVSIRDAQFQDLLEALRATTPAGRSTDSGEMTFTGPIYVDARTKPVREAWEETVAMLRQDARSGGNPLAGVAR